MAAGYFTPGAGARRRGTEEGQGPGAGRMSLVRVRPDHDTGRPEGAAAALRTTAAVRERAQYLPNRARAGDSRWFSRATTMHCLLRRGRSRRRHARPLPRPAHPVSTAVGAISRPAVWTARPSSMRGSPRGQIDACPRHDRPGRGQRAARRRRRRGLALRRGSHWRSASADPRVWAWRAGTRSAAAPSPATRHIRCRSTLAACAV